MKMATTETAQPEAELFPVNYFAIAAGTDRGSEKHAGTNAAYDTISTANRPVRVYDWLVDDDRPTGSCAADAVNAIRTDSSLNGLRSKGHRKHESSRGDDRNKQEPHHCFLG